MSIWDIPEQEGFLLKGLLCILRVPGLLILDICWTERASSLIPESFEPENLGETAISFSLLLLGLCGLLLSLRDLVDIYLHIISVGLVYLAHTITSMLLPDISTKLSVQACVQSILYILLLTFILNWSLRKKGLFPLLFPSLYTLPIFMALAGFSTVNYQSILLVIDKFMTGVILLYTLKTVPTVLRYMSAVKDIYSVVWEELGNIQFVLLIALRGFQPPVLVLYWIFSFSSQAWFYYMDLDTDKTYIIEDRDWLVDLTVIISETCYTPLILIGLCTTIMGLSKAVMDTLLWIFRKCAGGEVGVENPLAQTGFTEGMVAFVLALQTGLIDMEMPVRIAATYAIIFNVTSTLIQSAFEVSCPVLLALPAINRRLISHIPVLLVVLSILVIPILILFSVFDKVSNDLWLIIVISSYFVTVIQVVGALVTYSLFMWDSFQPEASEHMDDYVFYIKAGTKGFELLVAISIVTGGMYEYMMEDTEASLLNPFILLIHCYFNIYQRIASGWATYMSRRETKKRLSELLDATNDELEAHADVCIICYMQMQSAKKTECGHFFHSNCLKRWLYVQDNCPMCRAPIIHLINDEHNENSAQDGHHAAQEQAHTAQDGHHAAQDQARTAQGQEYAVQYQHLAAHDQEHAAQYQEHTAQDQRRAFHSLQPEDNDEECRPSPLPENETSPSDISEHVAEETRENLVLEDNQNNNDVFQDSATLRRRIFGNVAPSN
ncbi:RING finger protein 145 isoform X3 [Eurytemora carolleeae]|uniref:RING finger protein 145 isoform X3 n=1 Tax=Eurytemora carolleeae TaxID=1294199 RepID=UPI000C767CB5|nr:RING finger protein 145 isoform X3 [Eurytemora carolleeae]|eukprot:XP_023333019.1 RING finger protein 145-like isoform X3 [Eurytemora affinis]